jgi:uncharacterized protein YbjT (DUF2867 family)
MTRSSVLVLGAAGRFAPLVATLARTGHHVRAATRDLESPTARGLPTAGAEIVGVDLDDVDSITAAAQGADAIFFGGTAHAAGPGADERHGYLVVDAARAVQVSHLVYVSVAGAEEVTDVPLFESKRRVEQRLTASGVPYTIIAPTFFMENLWNPWNVASLARGRFPSPIAPARTIQQISIGDVIELAARVIAEPSEFIEARIPVAADDVSALDAVEIIAQHTGQRLSIDDHPSGGPAPLFSWLERVGYSIDIDQLRRRVPSISWRRYADWVRSQDWSFLWEATDGVSRPSAGRERWGRCTNDVPRQR